MWMMRVAVRVRGNTPGNLNSHSMTVFIAEAERKPGFVHVLLITTGSVASVKAPLIVEELLSVGLHFSCIFRMIDDQPIFSITK